LKVKKRDIKRELKVEITVRYVMAWGEISLLKIPSRIYLIYEEGKFVSPIFSFICQW